MLELHGNLYGRRSAGATFKNRFDEIMLEELKRHGYAFQKGKVDACVFTCPVSDVTIIHHVDDTGAGGSDQHLQYLHSNTSLGAYLDLKTSARIEAPGTMVRRLGRTKIRT